MNQEYESVTPAADTNQKLKAVIFDMDGVIADSEPGYFVAMSQVLEPFGKTMDPSVHDLIKGCSPRRSWEIILEHYGIADKDPQEAADEMMAFREEIFNREGCQPVPGVMELIKVLYDKGILMGIATSATRQKLNRIQDELGVRSYISSALSGSEECKTSKPDPEIYLTSAARLGVSPGACIVIEDAATGVLAAKRAGMKAVRLWTNSTPPEIGEADLVVTSLYDLDISKLEKLIAG